MKEKQIKNQLLVKLNRDFGTQKREIYEFLFFSHFRSIQLDGIEEKFGVIKSCF